MIILINLRELKNKTTEELFDLEMTYRTDEEDYSNRLLIDIYKELRKRYRNQDDQEQVTYIEQQMIKLYVWRGEYFKQVDVINIVEAEKNLQCALRLDSRLPIAHYRLGFLSYKKEDYHVATTHFDLALTTMSHHKRYKLNEQQIFRAQLYLMNSALFIASEAEASLKAYDQDTAQPLPNYAFSDLFDRIKANEMKISQGEYTSASREYIARISKQEAEDLIDQQDTLVCYVGLQENSINYNFKQQTVTPDTLEILRYLILFSSEQQPATKDDMAELFKTQTENGEVKNNTFRVRIKRLKEKVKLLGYEEDCIKSKQKNGVPGYYFEGEAVIIYPTDMSFILDK